MNFKSINNLVSDVRKWSEQIDFDYDYIFGIADSGVLVQHLLGVHTGKPITLGRGNGNQALMVDDSVLSGKTMKRCRKHRPEDKTGAVYIKRGREKLVDTYYEILEPPRIFEWNWFKSRHLQSTMMDIDGILCRDPTKAECDYGLKMLEFYATVKPKIIPTRAPLAYVTCRLEKYRQVTTDWLDVNLVPVMDLEQNRLIMRQRRSQGHGEFKAGIYAGCAKAKLFIESAPKQAHQIAKLSGKPVLCYTTMEML